MPGDKKTTFHKAIGCDQCTRGYKGRVGLYEVLRMTPNLRHLVINRAPTDEIREAACQDGMLTLKDYGIMLIEEGSTTVDEVLQCVVVQE